VTWSCTIIFQGASWSVSAILQRPPLVPALWLFEPHCTRVWSSSDGLRPSTARPLLSVIPPLPKHLPSASLWVLWIIILLPVPHPPPPASPLNKSSPLRVPVDHLWPVALLQLRDSSHVLHSGLDPVRELSSCAPVCVCAASAPPGLPPRRRRPQTTSVHAPQPGEQRISYGHQQRLLEAAFLLELWFFLYPSDPSF